jgi:glycosyltransferase involved in cell wall biosynthesis
MGEDALAMILAMTPFRADKNLGRAYNDAMELLPSDDDWAIFLDHDAMPTTPRWHSQIAEAIAFLPDAGAFVATTNRIASAWQRAGRQDTDDMAWHRRFGAEQTKIRTLLEISWTKGFGGVMFAVSKRAWREARGFADGLGCVDHSLHFGLQKVGRGVWMIEGLYVYHWRHNGEPDPTSSAPKAANCPCRGPELQPTRRIRLP